MSIRRHTTLNLIGAAIPLGVSLVTLPIYLDLIGEARYGVLAVAWLLLGYFGLLDLGLGRAVAQRVAALASASPRDRARTLWAALPLNLGFGIVGGLIVWPVATFFFGSVIKVDPALRIEMLSAVPWMALALPVATIMAVLSGALEGRQRFLQLNVISVLGTILFQVLPLLVAASFGPDLGHLLPAALGARFLTLMALFWQCQRHVSEGRVMRPARAEMGKILRFGGWVTVTSIISPIMLILDRFVIGATIDAKAVTFYTVPFQLAERSAILTQALSMALFPRFATASLEEGDRIALEGMRALAVTLTPLIMVAVLFVGPFLSWWISEDFAARSTMVGQLLLLGFWVNGFARIPFARLQAEGRPDLTAKCHAGELLPYLVLLFLGLHFLGLIGAAIAFSIRVLVDLLLLCALSGLLARTLRILVVPTVLVSISFLIAIGLEAFGAKHIVAILGLFVATFAWCVIVMPQSIWELLRLRPNRLRMPAGRTGDK